MKVALFSSNKHKISEIEAIFGDCVSYKKLLDKDISVLEDGKSFLENARKKITALLEAMAENLKTSEIEEILGEYILMSEDSGICVEALNEMPGIYSARYANIGDLGDFKAISKEAALKKISKAKDAESSANINRILSELKERNLAESRAYFVSCVCVFKGDKNNANKSFEKITNDILLKGRFLSTHGFLEGKVVNKILGQNGFGYDPIFIPKGSTKSLGELDSSIKNQISHRFRALEYMRFLLS